MRFFTKYSLSLNRKIKSIQNILLRTFFKLIFLLFATLLMAYTNYDPQGVNSSKHEVHEVINMDETWFKDTDGDGIKDKKDACPNVPGLKEFNGCPDTDLDGIEDSKDFCPEIPGLKSLKGCPDSDGDGFSDKEDLCPDLFGLEVFNGCPDTDGDGVMDSKDDCPNVAGLIENKGCPGNIKNKNSLVFKEDIETNESNDMDHKGLVITPSDLEIINAIAKGIDFKSGNALYNKSTSDQLDAIAQILGNFGNSKWQIEGYTDSIGSEDSNLKLSAQRAKTVRDYLIYKGLNPKYLTAIGYGEKNPIDTNMYEKGRANNRRVYFKFVE